MMQRGQPKASVVKEPPLKHVIEQYSNKAQHVTCVCGWQGSSASVGTEPSPWTTHVRESKVGSR